MVYQLTTVYVIACDLVLLGFLVEMLRRAGASAPVRAATAVGGAAWIALLTALLPAQAIYPADVTPMAFFASILAVVAAFTVVGWVTPLGKSLAASSQDLLMLPQGLRAFFGAGFLIQGVVGVMPEGFAVADGITHITAAFLCLKAAVLTLNGSARHGELWSANLFGLLDIVVVACGLSFFLLSEVGPHHNVMLAALFAAPVFINLHLVSLAKLIAERKKTPADGAVADAAPEASLSA